MKSMHIIARLSGERAFQVSLLFKRQSIGLGVYNYTPTAWGKCHFDPGKQVKGMSDQITESSKPLNTLTDSIKINRPVRVYCITYVCTERIFDSRPFMNNKVSLENIL